MTTGDSNLLLWLRCICCGLLAGFLTYYLIRSWNRRMVTLPSAYRSFDFSRDSKPVAYWLTYLGYLLLDVLSFCCLYVIIRRLFDGPV
jgi:hypothetical protein